MAVLCGLCNRRSGSRPRRDRAAAWTTGLTSSARPGIQVYRDPCGPAGPRRQAEFHAIEAYRQQLASRDGVLEYALLAADLPPMRHERLADSFQVEVSTVGEPRVREGRLLDTARKWPRMLLSGLPGAGKSTALEQLAARWAGEKAAPVPVLVPLKDVARHEPRRGADVTLDRLVEAATVGAPADERAVLNCALTGALRQGDAALLLDGLDECRKYAGVVTDGLAEVFNELHPDTGVVLASRDSALPAAAKLRLPHARLSEPQWLPQVMRQLLRHVAEYRVAEADRVAWIQERQAWIDGARRDDDDPWRVPLLASLMTLLAASREVDRLPTGRAQLLADAIQESVERWEVTRDPLPVGGWQPQLRPELLIDGYAEIAHASS